MVLTCHLSPPSHSISAIMHVCGAAERGYVICQCVSIAAMSLTAHIKPRYALLTLPFKGRVWKGCNNRDVLTWNKLLPCIFFYQDQ